MFEKEQRRLNQETKRKRKIHSNEKIEVSKKEESNPVGNENDRHKINVSP